MYEEHPIFKTPEDNAKIWRYMDFTKFVSLLDESALFFARADKLGDPFEGSYTKENLSQRRIAFQKDSDNMPEAAKRFFGQTQPSLTKFYRVLPKLTFINSWHEDEYESAAMWKLYLKSNEGIAIQSTFIRLKDCFGNGTPNVHIGEVHYIDYDADVIPVGNVFYPFLHKRKSFQHEQELRAVIQLWSSIRMTRSGRHTTAKGTPEEGISVPVDLQTLIDKIYLAPTSPKWLLEVVESVTRKYGLGKKVLQSSLDDVPVY